jgi:predicted transcriptional regulator
VNRKLNIGLSLCAGLLGGIVSHYVMSGKVFAQEFTAPPKQITAQSFVLVDDKGQPFGKLGFDKAGNPSIMLLDKSGSVVWTQNGKVNVQPLEIR